ncbi:UNVERIFIED_CONTAM: F-box/FBD/LRR-repeat protein [Sesamum indicum]
MESKSKKLKRNQERKEERCDLDKLSCLPDSILTHVLSFLDTKSAIRTSVLSKRYRLLWTFSPCLDFKLSEFCTRSLDSYDGYVFSQVKNSSVASFESYVNHVLRRREHSNLTMFRLSLHKDVGLEFTENCVNYAAQHKVQHLRIRGFVKRKPLTLPKLLLTSSSLITLHLHNATSYCIELPKSVALPNLKVLRLKNFQFSNKNFNGQVFSGCSSLEILVLSKCCIKPGNSLKILDVNCLNLKNLEIKYWRSPWKCYDEHMINVSAPRLASFKFQGHLARVNFKEALPCLDEACIDLCYPTSCFGVDASERKLRTSERFLSVLRDICNVKFLSLSLKTIEILSVLPDLQVCALTIFENLRFLKFTTEDKYREKTMRIETVMRLLERIGTDVLVLDGSKEQKQKLLPESANCKSKHKDATHIAIPANVIHFFLESSPAAEFLSVEIPKNEESRCHEMSKVLVYKVVCGFVFDECIGRIAWLGRDYPVAVPNAGY